MSPPNDRSRPEGRLSRLGGLPKTLAPTSASPTDPAARVDAGFTLWARTRDELGLSVRLPQERLFRDVTATVADGQVVFGSAPCGAGKSLLVVPLRVFAGKNGRVVHSSFTKAQQQQMARDGHELVRLGVFTRVVEVRGRADYLCNRRRAAITDPSVEIVEPDGAGLRSDLETALGHPISDAEWQASCSDPDDGCGSECGDRDFSNRARWAARTPGCLLIVNHALLALDVKTNGAILGVGAVDCLVVDEGHQAPDAFRGALGVSITASRLRRLRSMARREIGLVVEDDGPKALEQFLRSFDLAQTRKTTGDPFIYVRMWDQRLSLAQAWVDGIGISARRLAENNDDGDEVAAAKRVARVAGRLGDAFTQLAEGLGRVEHAAWVEQAAPGRNRIEMRSMDVSAFARGLFAGTAATVVTSATVESAVSELGGGRLISVGSPFDEHANRVGVVSSNGRGGRVDDARRLDELVTAVRAAEGGVLVLASTNAVQMGGRRRSMLDACEERLRHEGFSVGVQRATSDVPGLVAGLKDGSLDVLVGTMSCREGIDVPGDRLSMVILLALQWPYMQDPLLRSRMDRAGAAKWELLTPLMESNTRQAVGRLLRAPTDRGHIVLLDGRVHAVAKFRALVAPSDVLEFAALREAATQAREGSHS